jgi:hypothetical protein
MGILDKIKASFCGCTPAVKPVEPAAPEEVKPNPTVAPEPERPSASAPATKSLWYPLAHIPKNFAMPSKGKYKDYYPVGAIVHFTAGRFEKGLQSALDTMSWGLKQGYNYMSMAADGQVVQSCPLSDWGYHAGASVWPELGSSVSSKLVGIEICCAGRLTVEGDKFMSWFNTEIPKELVRTVKSRDNIQAGSYHKYTEAQEKSLVELLIWLKANNPTVFNFDFVLGHDEVAPTRKNDPSGALSMSMPEFREYLKAEYKKRYS